MRTLFVYLLALGALAAAASFSFPELFGATPAESAGRAAGDEMLPSVILAPAARGPFADTLDALGTVRANESVAITANRADNVVAIHFEGGQEVETGDLLVEMEVEEEQALLAEAAAIRDERKTNHDRVLELFEKQVSSERELINAKALLSAAEARVISLEAAIADRMVRAPFSGTLGLRRISVGAYLQPSTVITTLDDLSVVKLDFTIPETWLSFVREGMPIASRSDAWPDDEFPGKVVILDTRLDAETRSATVRAVLPNPERKLRPGMLLKVRVDRGQDPVLQVPEEALIPIGEQQFVLRVDEHDVASKIRITTGRRRVGVVEVLGGLEEGDRVVVEGIVQVRPGSKVRVVATRAPNSE